MHSTPRMRLGLVLWLGLAMGVSGGLAGCGGQSAGQAGAGLPTESAAARALQGIWVVEGFQPVVPFEPIMGAFVAAQYGQMMVSFDGSVLRSESIGLRFERRYVVRNSPISELDIQILDEGVTYDFSGYFEGNRLHFNCLTQPWKGKGTLVRQQ